MGNTDSTLYGIYEEVKLTIKGDKTMKRTFTVDASKKVQAAEEVENPKMEQLDELHDRVEDDFGYVIAGIERLGREGMLDEALSLLNTLADTLNSAISIIGDDFDNGSDITEEI